MGAGKNVLAAQLSRYPSIQKERPKILSIRSALDVHFHDQNLVSCQFKSNASGAGRQLAEVLHFCAFTARQFGNLGNIPEASKTARMIMDLEGSPERLRELAKRGRAGEFVQNNYSGTRGDRRFETRLAMPGGLQFEIKAKGFGLLARGKRNCASMSIISLLVHFGS